MIYMTVDGKPIGKVDTVEANIVQPTEQKIAFDYSREGSITMTSFESNLKMMPKETRQWCKRINWNGKVYL